MQKATWKHMCLFKRTDFLSFGYIYSSKPYGSSIFNFVKTLYAIFHNGCTNLLGHQKHKSVPLFLHFYQLSLLITFSWYIYLIDTILPQIWNPDICNNADWSGGRYIKWDKLGTERQILRCLTLESITLTSEKLKE